MNNITKTFLFIFFYDTLISQFEMHTFTIRCSMKLSKDEKKKMIKQCRKDLGSSIIKLVKSYFKGFKDLNHLAKQKGGIIKSKKDTDYSPSPYTIKKEQLDRLSNVVYKVGKKLNIQSGNKAIIEIAEGMMGDRFKNINLKEEQKEQSGENNNEPTRRKEK